MFRPTIDEIPPLLPLPASKKNGGLKESRRFEIGCFADTKNLLFTWMKDLPVAGFYENALVFFGQRHQYICEGNSMLPTLRNGEVVLVDRTAPIKVGDIVVARHPVEQTSELIKRVERVTERGTYFLVGDNPDDSHDSRHFGAVTKDYIKGKVVARAKERRL